MTITVKSRKLKHRIYFNRNAAEGNSNIAFVEVHCGFRPAKIVAHMGGIESTDPTIKTFKSEINVLEFTNKGFWLSHELTPVYHAGDDARNHPQDAWADYTVYLDLYRNDDTNSGSGSRRR